MKHPVAERHLPPLAGALGPACSGRWEHLSAGFTRPLQQDRVEGAAVDGHTALDLHPLLVEATPADARLRHPREIPCRHPFTHTERLEQRPDGGAERLTYMRAREAVLLGNRDAATEQCEPRRERRARRAAADDADLELVVHDPAGK